MALSHQGRGNAEEEREARKKVARKKLDGCAVAVGHIPPRHAWNCDTDFEEMDIVNVTPATDPYHVSNTVFILRA